MNVDVVVIGSGNAGMAAACSAAGAGARTVVVDAAPPEQLGGNSRYTANLRFCFPSLGALRELQPFSDAELRLVHEATGDGCPPDELATDWLATCGGVARPDLVEAVCAGSWSTVRWMADLGHRWSCERGRLPGGLCLHHDGGGPAFVRRWHLAAAQRGIAVVAGTDVTELRCRRRDGRWVVGAESAPAASVPIVASAVVVASGGFEASRRLRQAHLGSPWEDVDVRGTVHNTGALLAHLLDRGAQGAGPLGGVHAVAYRRRHRWAVCSDDPRKEEANRRYAFPFGAMVDRTGARLVDERAAPSNRVYASIGRRIVEAPGRRAFQVFDRSVGEAGVLPAGYCPPDIELASPAQLCERFRWSGVPGPVAEPEALLRAVDEGRRLAAQHAGIELASTGGYWVYLVEPALTFTFHGLDVDLDGAVRWTGAGTGAETDRPGVFAAGEAVGGLYDDNYLGGTGLLAGAVLGRRAGAAAAVWARR